jgi:hypothetical protein
LAAGKRRTVEPFSLRVGLVPALGRMLGIKLLAIPRELLSQLIASCFCGRDEAVVVIKYGNKRFGHANIVSPKNHRHIARSESIKAK